MRYLPLKTNMNTPNMRTWLIEWSVAMKERHDADKPEGKKKKKNTMTGA